MHLYFDTPEMYCKNTCQYYMYLDFSRYDVNELSF